MEDDYRRQHVCTVGGNPNLSCYPTASVHPVMVPMQKQPKRDWQKVCTVMILILTLVILACLALGTTYIIQLRMEFEKIKQVQGEKSSHAKMIGAPKVTKQSTVAAHLTGMCPAKNSKTLLWEDSKDNAFTSGIHYKGGSLIINETGHFLIYSQIYFRGLECKSNTLLEQKVFKRTNLYPKDVVLMITRNNLYCPEKEELWSRSSFQTGIFKLFRGDHIYVNVSNPKLVNFDQFYTFFGLHKL
ncbi:tumor necrosis factor ligand superfamily member 6-like [Pristis pectinata]|uniref:tumor necrosis factor ligand superfamily member 6-like n=1 Tax=Pristis pectinata TaxID=685728 RepID=UPI00223E45DF|nr:tumor necrosis factor ligand superfamily member 6-like [Pristis pectinata]